MNVIEFPVEALDDETLSPSEVFLLAQILRFQSQIEKITVNNLSQHVRLSKNTILKGLLLLSVNGYLTTLPGHQGWEINSVKVCLSERSENQFLSSSSFAPESEKERSKEKEKENNNDLKENSIYINNNKGVKENEKERENKKREKTEEEDEETVKKSKACREIIAYLNEKTGKRFTAKSRDTQGHISARLDEGFTVEDFKTVIDKKCKEWQGTDMEKYIRPETLFSRKFDRYLNETNIIRKTESGWDYRIDEPEDPIKDEIWSARAVGIVKHG